MITDNELIRLLELADPARVDDPAPVLEPAEYRDALLTGRTPVTLVNLVPTPSEPSSGRRRLILIAAAAAIVVAVALVAARDDATPADQPTPTVTVPPTTPPPTVTVSPTTPPRALRDAPSSCCPTSPGTNELVPGTYFVDEVNGTPTPRIYFTIGAWWDKFDAGSIGQLRPGTGAGFIMFDRPGAVFSDACHWEDGYHPGSLTTVDGLVAALSEQQGWADVTAPSDISIDGYVGKAFQRTAPADMSDCTTMNWGPRLSRPGLHPMFQSWENEDVSRAGFAYEPGQIETLLVLDIDGTIVVINTRPFPEASAADHAVFAAVLDSIRIERA